MCDTFVATKSVTKNHSLLIFGKNSDREPNEAQAILHIPRTKPKETHIHIRNLKIPQASETFEVYLSKPFQMWGAEMGANEFGLVIGNEAVFTKIPIPKRNDGLTGMELLRLALERCKTKEQALEFITSLLEEYGQDSLGGYKNKNFYYHNSFLIADSSGAILLETVDRHWVYRKLSGFYSISNGLTIGKEFDGTSEGIYEFALNQGLLRKGEDLDFSACFSDWFYTKMSKCKIRRETSMKMGTIFSQTEGIGTKEAMDILRSHHSPDFKPENGDMGSVCLHATGITTPNQTTGSMVFEVHENKRATVWLTGTSAPCLSLYKPFYFGSECLDEQNKPQPGAFYDDFSLWWQSERFHRLALYDYEYAHQLVYKESMDSERHWRRKDRELQEKRSSKRDLQEFSEYTWKHHEEILKLWTRDLKSRKKSPNPLNIFYNLYWYTQNKDANLIL